MRLKQRVQLLFCKNFKQNSYVWWYATCDKSQELILVEGLINTTNSIPFSIILEIFESKKTEKGSTWKKTSWNRQQCSPIHWDYRYYKINIYVEENSKHRQDPEDYELTDFAIADDYYHCHIHHNQLLLEYFVSV